MKKAGWAGHCEPHQAENAGVLVGLAALDPPYAFFRGGNEMARRLPADVMIEGIAE
jgi:hypothetical protein